jgi:hypothetical protein
VIEHSFSKGVHFVMHVKNVQTTPKYIHSIMGHFPLL